ncbi:MAG: NUDIX hydrolase [Hyphomicrobiaceae bacterium]
MDLTRLLTSRMTGLQVAALPLQRSPAGQVAVGLVTSRGTGRWVLPKGWPVPGLTLAETAAIEAREEAGLVGDISDTPIGRYRYRKGLHTFASMPCEVQVFPLQVREQLFAWRERKQRRVAFFWPEAAAQSVDEPELAALLRTLCAEGSFDP